MNRIGPRHDLDRRPIAAGTPDLEEVETSCQPPTLGIAQVGLSHWELFVIFFKVGLTFGGGLGMMAALEGELVRKRRAVGREDYLATYAIGRLVPSGTMTAVAVAYGHRFGGWIGSAIAITAMVMPSTFLTVVLTMAYEWLHDGPLLELLSRLVMPLALALIVVPALKFGQELSRSALEITIAAASLLAVVSLGLHPSLVLLAGGLAGVIGSAISSRRDRTEK
jgi:chromate transporter